MTAGREETPDDTVTEYRVVWRREGATARSRTHETWKAATKSALGLIGRDDVAELVELSIEERTVAPWELFGRILPREPRR